MTTTPERHPECGLTFVHVVDPAWGPMVNVHACLSSLARRHPWVQVVSPSDVFLEVDDNYPLGRRTTLRLNPLWRDPSVLMLLWQDRYDPGPKHERNCLAAQVYSEAMSANKDELLPSHLRVWQQFVAKAHNFDGVFGHTPWMKEMLAGAGLPSFVLPVGWDAEGMGGPLWSAPKHRMIAYYGSSVGRRRLVIPFLKDYFQRDESKFHEIVGAFGRQLLGQLDTSAAVLYVAHSPVTSFSTWRLWEAAATSALLIAEPGDSWPFEPTVHYQPIARFTIENAAAVTEDVMRFTVSGNRRLLAEAAHELARKFTVDFCESEYLVPAAVEMAKARV